MPIFARNADLAAAQSTPPNWPVNWVWGGPTTVAGGGGGGGPFNPPPWPPGQNPEDGLDIDGDPGTPTSTDERDPTEGPLSNYADIIAVVAPTNVYEDSAFTLTATYQNWTGVTDTGHDALGMTITASGSSSGALNIKQTSGGTFAASLAVTPSSGVFTASDLFLDLNSATDGETVTFTVKTTTVNTELGPTATYKPQGTDTSIFVAITFAFTAEASDPQSRDVAYTMTVAAQNSSAVTQTSYTGTATVTFVADASDVLNSGGSALTSATFAAGVFTTTTATITGGSGTDAATTTFSATNATSAVSTHDVGDTLCADVSNSVTCSSVKYWSVNVTIAGATCPNNTTCDTAVGTHDLDFNGTDFTKTIGGNLRIRIERTGCTGDVITWRLDAGGPPNGTCADLLDFGGFTIGTFPSPFSVPAEVGAGSCTGSAFNFTFTINSWKICT